jgi:hypothetical protein
MNSIIPIVIGVAILLMIVVLLLVRLSRRKGPTTIALVSEAAIVTRDTKAGTILRAFLSAAHSEQDAAAYQSILGQMKEMAGDVLEEIGHSYSRTQLGDYNARWSLVYVAGRLEHPSAISFWDGVVKQPIPPEESTDIHHFSSVAQEVSIRMRAIRGMAELASVGDDRVSELLLDYLSLPVFSLRAFAAYALLRLPGGESFRERISRTLPPDEQFVLDLKTASVPEVALIRKPAGFSVSSKPRSGFATKPSRSSGGPEARQARADSKSRRAPSINSSTKGGRDA